MLLIYNSYFFLVDSLIVKETASSILKAKIETLNSNYSRRLRFIDYEIGIRKNMIDNMKNKHFYIVYLLQSTVLEDQILSLQCDRRILVDQ